MYLGKAKKDIPSKVLSFKGELYFDEDTENLFCVSDSKGLVDGDRHIKLAIAKAQNKLNLLNRYHFRCFKKNCLYMFLAASLFDDDVDAFLEKYLLLTHEYSRSFSDVFLMAFDSIYWIDTIGKHIAKHDFSESEIRLLGDQVHLLRGVSDWKTGTPFVSTYKSILR